MTDRFSQSGIENIIIHEDKNEVTVTAGGVDYLITLADFASLNIQSGYADISLLAFAAEKLSCIKKAESYLSYGDLSRKQLCDKLKRHFNEDVILSVVKLLSDKGYIDDERLAVRYADNLAQKRRYGRTRIKAILYEKGFSSDDISTALESLDDDMLRDNLEYLLKTQGRKYNLTDRKQKAKLNNFLYRLGYSWDEIRTAIAEFSSDDGEWTE